MLCSLATGECYGRGDIQWHLHPSWGLLESSLHEQQLPVKQAPRATMEKKNFKYMFPGMKTILKNLKYAPRV